MRLERKNFSENPSLQTPIESCISSDSWSCHLSFRPTQRPQPFCRNPQHVHGVNFSNLFLNPTCSHYSMLGSDEGEMKLSLLIRCFEITCKGPRGNRTRGKVTESWNEPSWREPRACSQYIGWFQLNLENMGMTEFDAKVRVKRWSPLISAVGFEVLELPAILTSEPSCSLTFKVFGSTLSY